MDDETVTGAAADEPAPEPEVAAVSNAAPGLDRVEGFVERWWEDHFPGSEVARVTLAWNVAHGAKEALKTRLVEFLSSLQSPAKE